jgi:hypothetical protein
MQTTPLDGGFAVNPRFDLRQRLAVAPLAHPARLTLSEIKTEQRADAKMISVWLRTDICMANILFKCPRTGMNVQHWLADEPAPDDPQSSFETVVCPACSGIHFINRSSAKLLGEKEP